MMDPKDHVREGYNVVSCAYRADDAEDGEHGLWLEELAFHLTSAGAILDLGGQLAGRGTVDVLVTRGNGGLSAMGASGRVHGDLAPVYSGGQRRSYPPPGPCVIAGIGMSPMQGGDYDAYTTDYAAYVARREDGKGQKTRRKSGNSGQLSVLPELGLLRSTLSPSWPCGAPLSIPAFHS